MIRVICEFCVICVIRVMPVGPGPRIGVRGRLCAGMTMALRRPHKRDENG